MIFRILNICNDSIDFDYISTSNDDISRNAAICWIDFVRFSGKHLFDAPP